MSNNGHKSSRVPLKTPTKIKDVKFPNMYRIHFEAGGALHESLKGLFNSKGADKAIEDWVEGTSRKKIYPSAPKNDIPQRKVVDNGEEKSISRV